MSDSSVGPTQTKFLNVDLDIRVRGDLSALVAAMGRDVWVIHEERHRGRHWVRLSLIRPRSPEYAIRKLTRIMVKLPVSVRRTLRKATKEFDLGIEGGFEPQSTEWTLAPDVVQAVGAFGARMRITIYGIPQQ